MLIIEVHGQNIESRIFVSPLDYALNKIWLVIIDFVDFLW